MCIYYVIDQIIYIFCRYFYKLQKIMKPIKTQPTSYKDFFQLVNKTKQQKQAKNTKNTKIKQTPKSANTSITSLHSQSTYLLQKRSPSHNKIITERSCDKKGKICIQSYNNSHNQSINHSHNQSHNHSITTQTKPNISSKTSQSLTYHKFISQATTILSQILKIQTSQLLQTRISYIEYLQTLKLLKMIYQNYQPYPNDTVSQLWVECISNRNVGNFIIILCAILGLYDKKNQISEQEDKYLKNKYSSLKYTRMQLQRANNTDRGKQNQCTFTPQISQKSRKLATASKSKQKRQNRYHLHTQHASTDRNNISPIYKQKNKLSINQQYYQKLQTQPSTNMNIKHLKTDYTGNKRSEILYQRAKQKSCEKRQNKTTIDVQYQKNMKQLTFKPTILKIKKNYNRDIDTINYNKYTVPVRGQKNMISRMIRGRVQRQVRKIINQKGVPYNEKVVDKMRKQKYQQLSTNNILDSYQNTSNSSLQNTTSPITKKQPVYQPKIQPFIKQTLAPPVYSLAVTQQDIIIDVYLSEDHKEKLIIRKGQNIQQVAIQFIQKHGISYDKKQQLIQLLQISMKHALCPIDQLVDEQDQLASARTHYNYR